MGELIIFLIGVALSGLMAIAKIAVPLGLAWPWVFVPVVIAIAIIAGPCILCALDFD